MQSHETPAPTEMTSSSHRRFPTATDALSSSRRAHQRLKLQYGRSMRGCMPPSEILRWRWLLPKSVSNRDTNEPRHREARPPHLTTKASSNTTWPASHSNDDNSLYFSHPLFRYVPYRVAYAVSQDRFLDTSGVYRPPWRAGSEQGLRRLQSLPTPRHVRALRSPSRPPQCHNEGHNELGDQQHWGSIHNGRSSTRSAPAGGGSGGVW